MMETNKPSIVFMGTPEFALPALKAVHSEFGISAVVTVPDKPKGRGLKLIPSPVKEKALEFGLPVLQPESLSDTLFIEELKSYKPDIILVIAFRILPKEVYSLANLASFNIHASLLPKYRGAAPINWAIINGEKETGLTSFILEDKVDTGNILLQRKIQIPRNATAGDLHDLFMQVSAILAIETCNLLINGNYDLQQQDSSLASSAPKLFREKCKINWNENAENVKNYIHGTSPVPGAWSILDGKTLKIFRVDFAGNSFGQPGEYLIENSELKVNCLQGALTIKELQCEGKKPMPIYDFILGFRAETRGHFE